MEYYFGQYDASDPKQSIAHVISHNRHVHFTYIYQVPENACHNINNKQTTHAGHCVYRKNLAFIFADICIVLLEYILKGTVSRDFRPLVFFTNQSHLGH
jgi:hypothetical protein